MWASQLPYGIFTCEKWYEPVVNLTKWSRRVSDSSSASFPELEICFSMAYCTRLPVLNKSCLRKEPEWFPLKYLQERIDDFHRLFGLVLKNLQKWPSPPDFIALCYEVLGIWDSLGEILGRAGMRGIRSGDVVWVRKDAGKIIYVFTEQELRGGIKGESRDDVLYQMSGNSYYGCIPS